MNKREIAVEIVATKILLVRGRKVMLDKDLAGLYGASTMRLNEQVKRNRERFPKDFMFQLTKEEASNLISHFAISSWGGNRKLPHVFTEQGVAMLSSVLNSRRAIQVNIAIMRAFVRMREILFTNKDLAAKIDVLELKYKNHDMKLKGYDERIGEIFEAIKQLMTPLPVPEKPKIGFHH